MLTFLSVSSPFPTERDASISAPVALNLINFNALFTLHAKRKSVNKVLKCIYIYIYIYISMYHFLCETRFKVSHLSFVPGMRKMLCLLCCVLLCCVVLVFYGPSTLFRSFRARSVNLSTLYLGKPPRQFTST